MTKRRHVRLSPFIKKALIDAGILKSEAFKTFDRKRRYKTQGLLKDILEDILKCKAEGEKTFDWLVSPKGAALRIDIFFAPYNLCVEYQGRQHMHYPNAFHKTAEEFRYAAMCDEWKKRAVNKHGFILIYFYYDEKISPALVRARLKAAGIIGG